MTSVTHLREDQSRRWHEGERRLVESYLAQQPELQRDAHAVLELICNEIVLREERGERASLDEYVRRFPQFATELEFQLAVLRPLGSPETGRTADPSADVGIGPVPKPTIHGYEILEELGR